MDQGVVLNVKQAALFLSEWERLHQLPIPEDKYAEWKIFFSGWEHLALADVAAEENPLLDCEKFASFAQAFTNPYEDYRRSGAMTNVWQVAGIKHDELRNSQVLSWILDRFGDHGQGPAILARLVELAGKQRPVGVSAEMVCTTHYWTRVESLPLGDQESRVDIEIESAAFLIIIEVKVRAPETRDQLKRYVRLARDKEAKRPSMVIFLTPNGRRPKDVDLHEDVVCISWKQIASILDAHTSDVLGCSFSSRLFRQFADHARRLV
jgi:hypothetical protein